MVRRYIAISGVIEVGLAHIERVLLHSKRNFINNGFHRHHALRATKATKRRIRYRMCFTAYPLNRYVRQKVRVIGVKHRPVDNRIG